MTVPTSIPHLPRVLKEGMRGYDVVALRRALFRAGYGTWDEYVRNARPNSKMGPLMVERLKHYQAHNKRAKLTPDGEFGNMTYGAMVKDQAMDGYCLYLIRRQMGLPVLNASKAQLVLATALEGVRQADSIHYTQEWQRWEGIAKGILGPNQPHYADCSSYTTWLFWQARMRADGTAGQDNINGENWEGGYTGTQVNFGKVVPVGTGIVGQTLIFYGGTMGEPTHVALWAGNGKVVSHGSEGGPYYVNFNYRDDYTHARQYVL